MNRLRVTIRNIVLYAKSFFSLLNKRYPTDWDKARYVSKFYNEPSYNEPNPARVVFMCDGTLNMGGMADRLKGIMTTFYECKKHRRQFYINWTAPFDLTEYLVPASYDWRVSRNDISRDHNKVFPAIIEQGTIKQNLLKRCVFRLWFIFKPQEMHVFSNLKWHEKYYAHLYRELFKPSDNLNSHVNSHLSKLGAGKYYSFSFRFNELLGDFRDTIGTPLPNDQASLLIEKNIYELKKILDRMPSDYKAYIASDSSLFLEKVKNVDNRIYVIPKKIIHMCLNDPDENNNDVWLNTFLDFYLIMNAEKVYLLKTGDMYMSGFPELAAVVGQKDFIPHEF